MEGFFTMKIIFLVSFFILSCADKSSYYYNNKALESLKSNDLTRSYSYFTKSITQNPFHPIIHYNFIYYLILSKQYDKAIAEYLNLEKKPHLDKKLRFKVLFNLALIYSKNNQRDKALEVYQKALKILPESHEVRVNIEFLFKKPPKQDKKNPNQKNDQDQSQKGKKGENQSDQDQSQKDKEGESQNDQDQSQKDKEGESQKDSGKDSQSKGEKKDSSLSNYDQLQKNPNPSRQKGLLKDTNQKKAMDKVYMDRLLEGLKEKENKLRMRKYKDKKPRVRSEKDW